jgi:hypothetical protein
VSSKMSTGKQEFVAINVPHVSAPELCDFSEQMVTAVLVRKFML